MEQVTPMASKRQLEIRMSATLRGWKNLRAFDPYDALWLARALMVSKDAIQKAVKNHETDEGRELYPYSTGWIEYRKRKGLSLRPDYVSSGQLLDSMRCKVDSKMRGRVYFSGSHGSMRKVTAEKLRQKYVAINENIANCTTRSAEDREAARIAAEALRGSVARGRKGSITNQALADRLACRLGEGRWQAEGTDTPALPFMELGDSNRKLLERIYDQAVAMPKMMKLPGMKQSDFDSMLRQVLKVEE